MAVAFAPVAIAAVAGVEPKILSSVAGLPRCVGVPGLAEAKAWGCPIINVSQANGSVAEATCGPCIPPQALALVCTGQAIKNTTSRDATPVTFSLPVDTNTVKAEFFMYHFSDGTSHTAECAIPRGGPAGEGNELQTIAIVGDAGGWSDRQMVRTLKFRVRRSI